MPPKKHLKTSSTDQPSIKLQINEYYSMNPLLSSQTESKTKLSSLELAFNMQTKVDNYLKKSPSKALYSIAPCQPKRAVLKTQRSQQQLRSNQASTHRDDSTTTVRVNLLSSPKNQTSATIQFHRPESKHIKTQPQSLQTSMNKLDGLKQMAERMNTVSSALKSKLSSRTGSEDMRSINLDQIKAFKSTDQSNKFTKATANSQKSSKVVLVEKLTKNEPSLTLLVQLKGKILKYQIEISKNDVGGLLDFLKKEIEKIEPTLKGLFVGIHSDVSVPLDYLLSRRELPIAQIYQFVSQLAIEPILKQPRTGRMISLRDFDFIKCIGHGGFSQVYLVRDRSKGQYYAMKLVLKSHILGQGKQQIIQGERDIMSILDSPFIVKMHYAFESRRYLVFVLEYCSGGELFYLLRKIQVKRMSEEEAFFYFTEICLGMKHLHEKRIVYRDIKPENILIDFDGHVRIADFGLSKSHMGEDEVAYSFCGSPEYMAPEMLLKTGHSYQLDLYCLGALLYELITGLPPYYSRNTDEIYHRILNQKLTFPQGLRMTSHLKDLLSSLLVKNPERRISDINGILQHNWVQSFGGSKTIRLLQLRQIDPPFRPDPFHFNFDEQEFGQGESKFLAEMRQIQEQLSENNPKETCLPEFYYQDGKKLIEGEANELERHMIAKTILQHDKNDILGQLSHRATHQRMNTLDDFINIKALHQKKQSMQVRMQTEKQ